LLWTFCWKWWECPIQINGTLVAVSNYYDIVNNQGKNGAKGAGTALDTIGTGKNADIDSFLNGVDALGTNQAKALAILSSTPTLPVYYGTQVFTDLSKINSIVDSRLKGLNAGDPLFSEKNLWVKPFASYGKQKNQNGVSGFSANTKGISVGVDGEYATDKTIGISLSYTKGENELNDVIQNNDTKSYSVVLYGMMPLIDSSTILSYQLGAGMHDNDGRRYIEASNTYAYSNYDSVSYMAQVSLQKSIKMGENFTLAPLASLSYKYFRNPSYTESGAGGMNLEVDKFSDKESIIALGSDFYYQLGDTKLKASLIINYDFSEDPKTVSSNYQGDPSVTFNTEGIKNSHFTYSAALGVKSDITSTMSLDVGYNVDTKTSGFTNHGVSAKFNWKF
jgi:outer membrane autotransporter protein